MYIRKEEKGYWEKLLAPGQPVPPNMRVWFAMKEKYADEPKDIEIYIRVKPDLIPYGKIFSDKIRFEDLTFGACIPLEPFPSDKERKEQKRQDNRDEKAKKDNMAILADYERRKDEEKKRRMKIDGYAYANNGEMDEIQEENDEDVDSSKDESGSKNIRGIIIKY